MIPRSLRPLFWDVNGEKFDPSAFPDYTIARVLEFGDEEAVEWLRESFTEEAIKQVVANERRLSPRSANFWAVTYGIPAGEVAALKTNH